jgi:hypothetical protein
MLTARVNEQVVDLSVNHEHIARFSLNEPRDYEIEINVPAALLADTNVLVLKLPNAVEPDPTPTTADTRRLGIAVKRVEVSQYHLR